jgi:Tol biopolymer transport system component
MSLVAFSLVVALVAATGAPRDGSRTDTHKYTPLATDAGYQGAPAWSPDGKTLAYVADVDGVFQVFTRSLTSTQRAQVTHLRFDCHDPFWSPDGTRIYFHSLARDIDSLWAVSPAGGQPELILRAAARAALSPDGRTLAAFQQLSEQAAACVWESHHLLASSFDRR